MKYFALTKQHALLSDVSTPHLAAEVPALFEKIVDTTLTAAATSIDVTGLDINTDKEYLLIFRCKEATGGGGISIRIYINNDTTNTNYYTQYMIGDGAAAACGRDNDCLLVNPAASQDADVQVWIVRDVTGLARITLTECYNTTTAINAGFKGITKTATVTNITQITLTSSGANSLAIGSRLIIYKVSR